MAKAPKVFSDLIAYEALNPGDWVKWRVKNDEKDVRKGKQEGSEYDPTIISGVVKDRYPTFILIEADENGKRWGVNGGNHRETITRNMVRGGQIEFLVVAPGGKRSEKKTGEKKRQG